MRRYMNLAEGDFTSVPADKDDIGLFARSGEKWAALYRLFALQEDAKRGLNGRPVYSAAAAMRECSASPARKARKR